MPYSISYCLLFINKNAIFRLYISNYFKLFNFYCFLFIKNFDSKSKFKKKKKKINERYKFSTCLIKLNMYCMLFFQKK